MFERFTDRARRVVVLAQDEARLLRHDHIGTEHLLLGLIGEGEGVAAQVLTALGLRLDVVRARVEDAVGRGDLASANNIPFTPRARKVLEQSLREALQLGHNHIGTEHLLLGLLAEGESDAATALAGLGIDLETARARAEARLGRRALPGVATPIAFGDPALDALERALAEALTAGREVIDTADLLLGLVRQAERGFGIMAAAFDALGTSPEAVRAAVDGSAVDPGDL